MIEIAFRTNDASVPFPQQPKLAKPDVKGFVKAQPWHCKPWIDAQTLGLELHWPWNFSLVVGNVDGKLTCHREYTRGGVEPKPDDLSQFADGHYGVSSYHQLLLPDGYDGLILPHPRSYSDNANNMPDIIPGVLQMDWWPHIFFIVAKIPKPGEKQVWAAGQPFAQVVPYKREETSIRPMSMAESVEWDKRATWINEFRYQLSTHTWVDDRGGTFNNRYKILPAEIKRLGWDGLMAKGVVKKAAE